MQYREKRILYYGGIILVGIVVVFLVIEALLHIGSIGAALGGVVSALRAIVVGCILAYLLFPFARIAEQFLLYHHVKKKTSRTLSSLFALFCFLALIVAFAYFIIPQLVVSLPPLLQSLPGMIEQFSDQITGFLTDHGVSATVVTNLFDRIDSFFRSWLQDDPLSTLVDILGKAKGFAQSLLDFIIGMIVMVYVLMSRDQFVGQGKKILYAVVKRRSVCNEILRHLHTINQIFSGFVSGKLMDSLIIGIICGVVLSILRMPYTAVISVIIGVTNIIPVFGPFFGAIPSALLLLLTDPGKCLIFLVFIVVLQQVDGNIIGPKILGDSTGLSAFWVLFSLLLFSHFMGFWGMLLGVPLFASFYYLFREFIDSILRKKKLPVPTGEYIDVVSITPNGALIHAEPQKVHFPALFWGEDSLVNRLRRKKASAEGLKEDGRGEPSAEQTADLSQSEQAIVVPPVDDGDGPAV